MGGRNGMGLEKQLALIRKLEKVLPGRGSNKCKGLDANSEEIIG